MRVQTAVFCGQTTTEGFHHLQMVASLRGPRLPRVASGALMSFHHLQMVASLRDAVGQIG